MELFIAVAGIALVWIFAGVVKTFAVGTQAKAEIVAEKIIADAVKERTEIFDEFKRNMDGKNIYSHEEIMKHFKV